MVDLVTVIIPCFNMQDYIEETVLSIMAQTHPLIECIVVDDGSTDKSAEIIHMMIQQFPNVSYVSQQNQGPSVARNTGIRNAKGKYIQFLDGDDLLMPDKIKDQVNYFALNTDTDIIYSEYLCFNDGHRSETWTYSRVELQTDPLTDFASNWEKDLSIPIHCYLFRKQCFEQWGMFDETMTLSNEDWALQLNFALNGATYRFLPGQSSLYRVRHNSRCKIPRNMFKDKMKMLWRFLMDKRVPLKVRGIFARRIAESYRLRVQNSLSTIRSMLR